MGELLRFPTRLRPIQPMTAEQVEVRNALIVSLGVECGACFDKGVIHYETVFGLQYRPCICGTNNARACVATSDFDGAA